MERYRRDVSRVANKAAEESHIGFKMAYYFIFKVLKERQCGLNYVRENIKAFPGVIIIGEDELFTLQFNSNTSYSNSNVYNNGADYWEGRILARQESEYD